MLINSELTEKLHPISDNYIKKLKEEWYSSKQENPHKEKFINYADAWFKSSKLNDIRGWEAFPCKDIIIGCTNFIESVCLKYAWNIQILPSEYSYYSLMGIKSTNLGQLKPKTPLIISVPSWKYCAVDPQWNDILK